jgi:hypothetical protein
VGRLQIVCVEKGFEVAQGVKVTDGIDAASQVPAGVFASHPLRDGEAISAGLDFEEESPTVANPSGDLELPPEKRVKWVLNCYNTLVTGIIMFVLATSVRPIQKPLPTRIGRGSPSNFSRSVPG